MASILPPVELQQLPHSVILRGTAPAMFPLAGEAMLLQKLVPSAATTSIPSTTTPLPHHGPATQYKCKLKYKDKNKNWFFPLLLAYLSLHLHPDTPQAALSRGRGSQIHVERGKYPILFICQGSSMMQLDENILRSWKRNVL